MESEAKGLILSILAEILNEILEFPTNKISSLLQYLNVSAPTPQNPLSLIKSLGFSTPLPSNCLLIKSKFQYSESLCGFHALFYAKTFMKLLNKAKTLSNQLYYLLKLQSDSSFWKFYAKTLQKVLQNPNLDSIDHKDLKELGPLDSSHLDYLINSGFFSKYPVKTSSLFYGYGYFQCGIERIEASEILINSKEKGLIFLGITNHWMVLLTGFSEDFLLFDSRKNAGFLLGNSSIEEIGLFEEKERLSLGKKPMTIAEKRLFLNNIRDGDFLLKVLFEVKKGSFSLKSIYLNRVIFDILRSYEKQVNLRELEEYDYEAFSMKTQEFCFEIIEKKAENLKEKQEKFLDWAKNEKPPKVIREDLLEVLIKIGKEHLNKKTAIFLDNWMKEVEILYKTLEKDPIPQLLEVFKEIQDFFL